MGSYILFDVCVLSMFRFIFIYLNIDIKIRALLFYDRVSIIHFEIES